MEEDQHTTPRSSRIGQRIILLPLPAQGHLTPIFQLAYTLHNQGFKITIVHPQTLSPDQSNYPHFTFKSIYDGFSDIHKYMPKKPSTSFFVTYLNNNCMDSFRDCLAELLAEPNEPPVACLITDAEYYFAQDVANSLKVHRLVFWACNIVSVLVYRDLPSFYDKGCFNLTVKDSEFETRVPKYPILKIKDIVKITTNPKCSAELQRNIAKQIKASSGIIWNSFIQPEEAILENLKQDFGIPVFTLGPLQMYHPGFTSNQLLEEDRTFFSWLDAQKPKSVIYASFGSFAKVSKSEFQQVAHGLANIGFPFLWVVRPGVVEGSEWLEWLPEKFLEEVAGKGHIVKWCPQNEVLAHPAIGCFWTHSGWNSTLESVCKGVPMICSPCNVGQPIIARYVSDVWKIGVLLEDGLERMGIERAIKRVMLDKEGEEMRKRIK
uniref:UDP-glycosyltransferase 76B1-like isoform X2 n=1 Tax=Erigeron canadensis TaxID=72917 RepID=UPI001CB93FFF|nr:UDP-glycosyltransferase 76B1-like isoform X2 [Erigeron canadensis]